MTNKILPSATMIAAIILVAVGIFNNASAQKCPCSASKIISATKKNYNLEKSEEVLVEITGAESIDSNIEIDERFIERVIISSSDSFEEIVEEPVNEEPVIQMMHLINAGDVLKIHVFEEKELSGHYRVSGDGTISMPLIGVVDLTNKDVREAEQIITEAYKDGYLKRPSISIQIALEPSFSAPGDVSDMRTF